MPLRYLLSTALLATIAIYWIGLSGPLLFDDAANLAQIQRWLDGRASGFEAVFGTKSGFLHRPVSMATLALNAWLAGGIQPVLFKLFNLLVHLANGILLWHVFRLILSRDARLSSKAPLIASTVAALWLIHPLNASTVLYVVQRMTQLSTLFVLASLWAYVSARINQMDSGGHHAQWQLFIVFPLLVVAGLLSKENAAVAPVLCLVVELAWFKGHSGERLLKYFYGAFLALPILAGVLLLVAAPERLLGGYAMRDFGPWERLLSESRALMDYVCQSLVPQGARMGLYYDDFVVSTGLLSPPATLLCILSLAGLSAAALALRRRVPVVFAGWFFFLSAHAVESTVVPLELYFEHRNYLPLMGLLLALAGGCAYLVEALPLRVRKIVGLVAGVGFAGFLAFTTFGRATVWTSMESIAREGVRHHPLSLRAARDLATVDLHAGRLDASRATMTRLSGSPVISHRTTGLLGVASIDCIKDGRADPDVINKAMSFAQSPITLGDYQAYGLLLRIVQDKNCSGVTPGVVADAMLHVLALASSQPDSSGPKWRTRMITAKALAATSGRMPEALEQAKLAWQPNADVAVGSILIQLAVHLKDYELAETTLSEMEARLGPQEALGHAEVKRMRTFVVQSRVSGTQ